MEPVIGIDLGTTYSAVATVEGGKPVIIPSRQGSRLTPSVVGFTALGDRVVGERAQILGDEAPDRVAPATKRFIGKRWSSELAATARTVVPYPLTQGPSGEVRIKVAGRVMPLTQVSAMLLGELKLDAEAHFNQPVRRCVITVPANFDDGQRQATREAARIAGLEVLRIVNEPTAAAIAYGLVNSVRGRVLVFDLGGGTFDVSILEMENGVFEVRATGGDTALGGDDFDNCIVQWLTAQVPDLYREAVLKDRVSMQRLRYAAERAKRALTEQPEAFLSATELGDHSEGNDGRFCQLDTALTRDFFETLAAPLSERCIEVVSRTLAEAKLKAEDIEAVMLVGGMTRVPLLRSLVAKHFGKEPDARVDPDEAVALGAAIHAAELVEKRGQTLLLDVVGSAMGVEVAGGLVKPVLARNLMLPCRASQIFYPGRDGQTQVRVPICQGEGKRATETTQVGELVMESLESTVRSAHEIEVTFAMDVEGMLSVSAIDKFSGQAQEVRIDARTALGQSEAARLRADEQKHREQQASVDVEERRKNRHARRALHGALIAVRRLQRELLHVARESEADDAKELSEQLAPALIEADRVERSGSREEVEAMTQTLLQLLPA